MPSYRSRAIFICGLICAILLTGFAGCSSSDPDQRARDEKIRDDVAKATERAKPAIQEAGKQIGEAAHEAAHEARAAAEGVREGWTKGQHPLVDLNSAPESQLLELPGINRQATRKIIDARPYRDKHELLEKGVVSGATYQKIRDQVTAK